MPLDNKITPGVRGWGGGPQVQRAIVLAVACVCLYCAVCVVSTIMHLRRDADLVGAAGDGNAVQVQVLLRHGANPNATHLEGSSALWWAVCSQSLPTVQELLAAGASPDSRGQYDSVLDQALAEYSDAVGPSQQRNALSIVGALVSRGVNVRSVVKDPQVVMVLRRAGAKI
jgi:hypothetical protein